VTSKEVISDQDAFASQKSQTSSIPLVQQAIQTNVSVLEYAESLGVKSYVVVPPMVYGRGEGFGNKISIQFVALVRLGKSLGQLWQIGNKSDTWPFVHLLDVTDLYLYLIRGIVTPSSSASPSSGSSAPGGIYFAENGSYNWNTLSLAIISRLSEKGLAAKASELQVANEIDLQKMGEVIKCPPGIVPFQVAGFCSIRGDNGRALGWKPEYGLDHLMSSVPDEVDFILQEDK